MAIVDYEKTFESVQIKAVLEATREEGVSEIFCKILEHIYTKMGQRPSRHAKR